MRQLLVLFLLLVTGIAAVPAARADSNDPSDLFLNAYMSVQKGQKLEEDGKFKLALQKYRYAASLLQQIKDKSPTWQPLIVEYRLNKTSEAIALIEKKISVEGNGPMTEDVEPPLPDKSGGGNAPDVNVTPPSTGNSVPPPPPSNGNGDAFDTMRSNYQAMQRQLADVKEQLASAEHQKQVMAEKLDSVVKELDAAHVNEAQLTSQLKQAEQAYKTALDDKSKDSEGRKQYEDEIARLKNQLKEAHARADAAEDANDDAAQRVATFRTQRDSAMKERDDALDSLKKAKEGQAQVDKLMADNASLMQKLSDAEKQISQFNESAPAKDQQIASLKKEVADTREQLSAALKQSQDNLNSMNALQQDLESATTELAGIKNGAPVTSDDQKKLEQENLLLRGIVQRERKEEAHRDQEKKLALDELTKLHVQSDVLVEKLNYLGQPVLKLTDQERALFKEPEVSISDNSIHIEMEKPSTPSNASPSPSPSPASTSASPSPTPATADASPSASPTQLAMASTPTPAPLPDTSKPADNSATPGNNSTPQVLTNHTPPVSRELIPQANQAKDEFERGHYREAEKIYTEMLGTEPKNLYILSNLGVVRFRSGKLKPAEETFKKAIAVSPDDEFSHRTLGIVYYSESQQTDPSKLDAAVGELTKALTLNSKDAIAHNYLGITASAKGWQEAARKELETAVAIDPNYADAHFNLAVIYITTPPIDKEAAKKHYKRAVELGSEPDPALEQLLNK